MKLKDILKKQARLRDHVAVANAAIRVLNERYITSPVAPAEEQLVADDGSVVSEEAIKEFCQFINDNFLAPKRIELEKVENSDLTDIVISKILSDPSILPYAQLKEGSKKSS